MIPIYLVLTFSVKPSAEVLLHPLSFPTHPTTSNYSGAWKGTTGMGTLGRAMESSLIITGGSVVLLLVIGSLTAYTIARRPSRLTTGLYTCTSPGRTSG
jgi:ABC-type glycerol-3-phosphate transport system permease component